MVLSEEGSITSLRAMQLSKASASMSVKFSPSVMDFNAEQLSKALSLIDTTLFGSVKDVNSPMS